MLVLTRRSGETIAIDDNILVTIIEVSPGRVKLGITAPQHVSVDRLEVRTRREGGPRKVVYDVPVSHPLVNRITGQLPEEIPSTVVRKAPTQVDRIKRIRQKPR